eukprot:8031449-Alexandrium_andersonii.AAC.1
MKKCKQADCVSSAAASSSGPSVAASSSLEMLVEGAAEVDVGLKHELLMPFKRPAGHKGKRRSGARVQRAPEVRAKAKRAKPKASPKKVAAPLSMSRKCVHSRAYHGAKKVALERGLSGGDLRKFCIQAATDAVAAMPE